MKIYVHFILLLITCNLLGNLESSWEKTYGGENKDYGLDFVKYNEGYAICGRTKSFGASDWRAFLIKTDNGGTENWHKIFGEPNISSFNAITLSFDGNYLVTGKYEANTGSIFWIVKINPEGEIIWESTLGNGCGYAISEVEDNHIIVAGDGNSSSKNAVIAKLDSSGNIIWQHDCGNDAGIDKLKGCLMDNNGDYLFAGYSNSIIVGNYQAWVLKYSSTGELIWNKNYGEDEKDMVISIDNCKDGYIVAGQTRSYGVSKLNGLIIKLTYQGEIEWVNPAGGAKYDYLNSICTIKNENNEEKYIAVGSTKSFAVNKRAYSDGWIVELNSQGEETSKLIVGSEKSDFLWSVKNLGDNQFAAAGYMNKSSNGENDNYQTWLVNFNSNTVGIKELNPNNTELLENYPNPFNPTTTINFNLISDCKVELNIYNTKGELIEKLVNAKLNKGIHEVKFDAKDLNSGTYFYQLKTDLENQIKKMVVIK